jgi:hypothetical protein
MEAGAGAGLPRLTQNGPPKAQWQLEVKKITGDSTLFFQIREMEGKTIRPEEVSMGKKLYFIIWVLILTSCSTMKSAVYEEKLAQWTSYQDVASWMKANFYYDMDRNRMILGTKPQPRTPDQTFKLKSGVCYDAAVFARDTLNRIDPKYDAKIVFIKNSFGPPNHWATTFTMDGKLYIMDYGASSSWGKMNGIHGPYDSLHGYEEFLSSLTIPRFEVGQVKYTNAF